MQIVSDIIKETKLLHDLGFAIHLLHKNSKRPIESGWTTGVRKTWATLENNYQKGMNVGVRLGTTSKIGDRGYLACIDIDIKDPSCGAQAFAKVREIVGNKKCPEVRSGRGNGSRHLYCITSEPFKMITVSKHEGWEICIYSDGRQMVLPPSIHPDTGRAYTWKVPLLAIDDLPLFDFSQYQSLPGSNKNKRVRKAAISNVVNDIEIDETIGSSWTTKVNLKIQKLIVRGEWDSKIVDDRSAYLFFAASALTKAGFTKNQTLTILTDTSTYLGQTAYDKSHANTKSRVKAAKWVWKYTLKKVLEERKKIFPELRGDENWRLQLVRGGSNGDGPIKPTIENAVLILQNEIAPNIFKHDEFGVRDIYGIDTDWGRKNAAVTDDAISRMRLWFGRNFRVEPNKEIISDAVTNIAKENSFDPLKEWLEALPEWDETPRLNSWLVKNFQAKGDPAYLGEIFRKWMVALVMRQFQPGEKFDWMPIFEGRQGVGKSSFGRLLVGEKYFLDYLGDLSNKDSALGLQGMWAVEMGELASLRRNEIEIIKGYLSRSIDKVRPPYGKRMIDYPRRCVFYGTTNRDKYLKDETGNRRFKPIIVGQLNFAALEKDREQLFAEAKFLFMSKIETPISLSSLSSKAKVYELEIQNTRLMEDDSNLMEDLLKEYISNEDSDFSHLKITELFRGPLSKFKLDQKNMQHAARALKALGYIKTKHQGNSVWKFTARDRG